MTLQFFIATGIFSILNILVATRLASHVPMIPQQSTVFYFVFLLFFLVQIWGPFGGHLMADIGQKPGWISYLLRVTVWISYAALGTFTCLMMFTFLVDLGGLVWQWVRPPVDVASFHLNELRLIALLTVIALVGGLIQASLGPKVVYVDVPLKNLPESFHGFRIAQISDLHISHTIGKSYAQEVVDKTNAIGADVVALTGDFIDGTVTHLKDDIAPLGDLVAPQGVYFITGNHEYYWGADEWIAHFKSMGITVLMNDSVRLYKGGHEIALAGVTDYSTLKMKRGNVERMDPAKAAQGISEGMIKILLAHQPITYKWSQPAGYDLQLSGHTHGGQYFPFNLFIGLFQKFYKGLNQYQDMWIYVNTGTGYWGPPLRLGVPAEITVVTLVSAH